MADLHVSKKNISKLLSDMQGRKFIIPDFQRPYKWNIEKCETLWNDIENFLQTEAESGSDYFLGTVVSYVSGRDVEIIDGQQRITSFFLLLRAFYKKLEDMVEDKDVIGLKNQVAPCIWDIDPISQQISDKARIHIESRVATEEDNEVFHSILQTGLYVEKAEDNYSRNYGYFKTKCDDYAALNPLNWKKLCVTILQKCIILPIECDTPETALTIFSTLNDRGLPLADSDIFKAQIYRSIDGKDARKEFTERWKDLMQICKNSHITIDDIFRYYSHVLRASNRDKTKEVGLRKFYAAENYKLLKQAGFIEDIITLANFWQYVNAGLPSDDTYTITKDAERYLHCLSHYPNEFWKYATSVFFVKNKDSKSFDDDFTVFLKKLVAFLFAKFIDTPSINAIKDDIYVAVIGIYHDNNLDVAYEVNPDFISKKMEEQSSSRLSRALLLLDAYLNPEQSDAIPFIFDIEHIFPKKWQNTNYNGWTEEQAKLSLDKFGNKVVFEKKLNIQAGNGYFGVKKLKYKGSKIANVIDLSNYSKNDWVKDDIDKREEEFKSRIIDFLKSQLSNN
jgi:uncharacterized protein with ParB-like and HNH nuclease domain